MRLFICEYVTGGGYLGSPLPGSLAHEGDMMLAALVKDVAALGIDIVTARDPRLAVPALPADWRMLNAGDDPWAVWRTTVAAADALWPIAPETGGALARLSELAAGAGRLLVGCRRDAVDLAASKRATAERLAACGVAAVPTWRADTIRVDALPDSAAGWVLKPDDGAGAESTRLFRRRGDLLRALDATPELRDMVVQPFVAGTPASLSVLCCDGRAWLLSCNRQDIVIDGNAFGYRGGVVGALEARRAVYAAVAEAVAAALPGLWGYVGIDLVDRAAGPVVLEVNPRLTTSYVGLGRAIGINPAGLVLRLLDTGLDALKRPLQVTPQRVDLVMAHA